MDGMAATATRLLWLHSIQALECNQEAHLQIDSC